MSKAVCSLGLGQKSLLRPSSSINSTGDEWEVVGAGLVSPPKFQAHAFSLMYTSRMPSPLCGNICSDRSPAGWHPRTSSGQFQSVAGSFWRSCPLMLPPLGTSPNKSPHWEGWPREPCSYYMTLPPYCSWLDRYLTQGKSKLLSGVWLKEWIKFNFCSHIWR